MRSFITPHATHSLLKFIEEHQDKKLIFEVRPYKKPRSLDANAYWWGVVVTPLAEHCGYSPAEMHVELCGSFFGWKTVEFRGHKREVPRRTTTSPDKLGTMEFAELIHHGQQIAADLGVSLPDQEAA